MTDTHAQLIAGAFPRAERQSRRRRHGRQAAASGRRGLPQSISASRPNRGCAHAFTFLDFAEAAHRYGRLGGFAHLKTLIDRLRAEAGAGHSLLLDGGDLWQGSGLANAMHGEDMVDAANLLGIEAMTGHWEFTYGEERLRANLKRFKGEFLAQNVFLTEEAAFNDKPSFDKASGRVFKPATIKEVGGYPHRHHRPGVPLRADRASQALHAGLDLRHPRRRDAEGRRRAARKRTRSTPSCCSRTTAWTWTLKLAGRVTGIDVILGGHTHDAVPQPVAVANSGGKTLVTNAGSSGKFLGVLDLDLAKGAVKDVRYHLLPIYAGLLKARPRDAGADRYVCASRTPTKFGEKLAVAGDLLYRRGNFNGTMDQLICDALRHELDAELALSPGFRWGNTMLPGEPITMEDVLSETAITYPEVYVHGDDRRADQGHHGRHLRQSVQSRSLLPAGRRHGAHGRHGLCLRAGRERGQAHFRLDARQWPQA